MHGLTKECLGHFDQICLDSVLVYFDLVMLACIPLNPRVWFTLFSASS